MYKLVGIKKKKFYYCVHGYFYIIRVYSDIENMHELCVKLLNQVKI